jgi:uncharacterized protein (TIGR02300 family)
MSKAEWGKKVVCPECETKFYDLNRKYPLECVNCGFVIKLETEIKVSSSAKKVYEDDLETEVDNNLIGSDASESMIVDSDEEDADIVMEDDNDTISLDDADTNVGIEDIDDSLDTLPIDNEEDSLEEK